MNYPMNPMGGAPGMMDQQMGMMGQQGMSPAMFGPQLPPSGLVNLDPDYAPGAVTLDLDYPSYPGYPCPPHQAMGGMHHHHCPPPCPPPTPEPTTYVVKKGDSVYKIAKKFGTTMQAIILANNLRNPDLIFPGQVLYIPGV
jgi:nucleoid-associated protein YgaU